MAGHTTGVFRDRDYGNQQEIFSCHKGRWRGILRLSDNLLARTLASARLFFKYVVFRAVENRVLYPSGLSIKAVQLNLKSRISAICLVQAAVATWVAKLASSSRAALGRAAQPVVIAIA